MLDNLSLAHMNGRVYDQMLARFTSGDPFVPDATNTQSYNRYSYVRGNPLSRIDPSGFSDGPSDCSDRISDCYGAYQLGRDPRFTCGTAYGCGNSSSPDLGDVIATSTAARVAANPPVPALGVGRDSAEAWSGAEDPRAGPTTGGLWTGPVGACTTYGCLPPGLRKSMTTAEWVILGMAVGGPAAAYGAVWALVNPLTATAITEGIVLGDALGGAGLVAVGAGGAKLAAEVIENSAARAARAVAHDINALSRAAGVLDKNGVSVAAKALQSHSDRVGSAFARVSGNAASRNAAGQAVIDDILNASGSTFTSRTTGRFGEVLDVVAPDGRGVRFGSDGSFIGLLEPPR